MKVGQNVYINSDEEDKTLFPDAFNKNQYFKKQSKNEFQRNSQQYNLDIDLKQAKTIDVDVVDNRHQRNYSNQSPKYNYPLFKNHVLNNRFKIYTQIEPQN